MTDLVRIVLIDPSHPGNIGSVARAMKNMALSDLILVRPRSFPHPESVALAAGADDILTNARVVDSVAEGGPAEKAGLKAGDVIVKINDLVVKETGLAAKDVEAAGNEILKHKAGDKIKLTVKREGKEHRLEVTVGK